MILKLGRRPVPRGDVTRAYIGGVCIPDVAGSDQPARDSVTTAPSQRPNVLALVALAMLPLLVLAAVGSWRSVRDAEARVAVERAALAGAAALRAGAFVDDNLSTIRTLSVTRALTDPANAPNLPE